MGTSEGIDSPPAPSAGSGAGVAGTALAGAPELAAISAGFFPRVSFCVDGVASGFGEGPDEQAARTASASNCFLIVASISRLPIRLLALRRVRADPLEHRAIPEEAVARLQYPVALVREVEQPRLDALPLQRGEHPQPLLDGNAEVELALHDERRSLEILYVRARAPFPIGLRHLPGWAAHLPFREPQLFRRAIHGRDVVDAVVRDEAPEAIGVAGNPVDHVPAVGGAGGAGAAGLDERQLLRGVRRSDDVAASEPAPVARDLLLESVTVPGRAMEVRHQDDVALRGESRLVPAHPPLVFPGA